MIIVLIMIFGCSSNRQVVDFLRECKNLEQDKNGFVLVQKSALQKHLKKDDFLRYVGSDKNDHYFIHYYDKTIKIQSQFKLEGTISGLERQIDISKNLLYKKENGKFRDSYTIKVDIL